MKLTNRVTLSLSKGCLLLIAYSLLLTSCATYNRCQSKFQNTSVSERSRRPDSIKVIVPVPVLVPRDSVITTFVTDTTYLYKEIQQGRAKVIVERTNHITTVQARCDTVTITKLVKVNVPGQTISWGVAPWYKKAFTYMLYLFILAAGVVFVIFQNRKSNT